MSVLLREIMATDVEVTAADASVSAAAAVMVAARIGSALVMNGSTLVGIITERDVLRAAASGEALGTERVRDWMTPDPVTAGPEMDIDTATETMLSQGFRHLPVVVDRKVEGIVSLRDLFSARIGRRV